MDNSVIKQDFGMVGDLTTAFRDYAKSLGRMDLYNYNFTFRRDDAKGLTEDEFGKMMDYYQISEAQRYGSRARSLVIDHQESGPIRKTILIFARSKKQRYDVVVAEGKMSINVDWERYCSSLLFWHVRLPLFIAIFLCNKIQQALTYIKTLLFSSTFFKNYLPGLFSAGLDWLQASQVS